MFEWSTNDQSETFLTDVRKKCKEHSVGTSDDPLAHTMAIFSKMNINKHELSQ